jgi:hypothetical protein
MRSEPLLVLLLGHGIAPVGSSATVHRHVDQGRVWRAAVEVPLVASIARAYGIAGRGRRRSSRRLAPP